MSKMKVSRVESGIVIPKASRKVKAASYPFAAMKIGDSFKVTGGSKSTKTQVLNRARKEHPKLKFTARPEGRGFRVWRTA